MVLKSSGCKSSKTIMEQILFTEDYVLSVQRNTNDKKKKQKNYFSESTHVM